jgi:hypothetical protein
MKRRIGTLVFGAARVPVYEVSRGHFDVEEDGEEAWGEYDIDKREIWIHDGLDRGFFAQVLLHEHTHAALRLLTRYHTAEEGNRLYFEEGICDAVGSGMSQNLEELLRMINAKKVRQ